MAATGRCGAVGHRGPTPSDARQAGRTVRVGEWGPERVEITDFFYGNALSVVDGKSRVSLPANLRAVAERRADKNPTSSDKAVLLGEHPRHPCLQGYDPAFQSVLFQRLQAKVALAGGDPVDALDDELLESFGTAVEVGYDPGGRFVLPAPLRAVAGIELNGLALFVAAAETFQIWHPDRFRAAHVAKPRLIRALDALLEMRK